MDVLLFRRKLDLKSGAGQLIAMQAEGLTKAGHRVRVTCRRGALKFFLRTGQRAVRLSERRIANLNSATDTLVIDHAMELPGADLVFAHNLMTEANRFLEREYLQAEVAREAAFFSRLAPDTHIVANSGLVKSALMDHFSLREDRVVVHYPGFSSERFNTVSAERLGEPARRALKVAPDTSLIGFVTSGDFHKRGLDTFLAAAEQIVAARPEVRFLVVGARRLPDWALHHRLFRDGRVSYRPKSKQPERWMAALDVFLYPARFEEFGMVVSEARAMGLPILTSRRVGASECLPEDYAPWLLDAPDAADFAALALTLIGNSGARDALAVAGRQGLERLDRHSYARASLATIAAQNR